MKVKIFSLGVLGLFLSLGLAVAGSLAAVGWAFGEEKPSGRLAKARDEIQILNLLNALDLTKSQMEFILKKALKAGDIRRRAEEETARHEAALAEAYGVVREEVASGRVHLDPADVRSFHKAQRPAERAVKEAAKTIRALARDIEGQLTSPQLFMLDDYKPCVIPRTQEGRIGQAGTPAHLVKIFERVRGFSDEQYESQKSALISSMLEEAPLQAALEADEAVLKAKIEDIFEKARQYDEADFMIQKDKLAEELKEGFHPARRDVPRVDKIRKFLLSEETIVILRARLAQAT